MNIKAERIEQLIQTINRNLLMITSGQGEGMVPMEGRHLQKVDTVIFGHDKFAFEMVHFVKSAGDNLNKRDKSVATQWEVNFLFGLESLLVECAVINDDIERDCFVSRVYCWFTEKLVERRELPRQAFGSLDELKSSIRSMNGNFTHTLKSLETFDPEKSIEATKLASHAKMTETTDNEDLLIDLNDRDLPVIQQPEKRNKFGSRGIPQYVKNGFPEIIPANNNKMDLHSFLPHIPGAEENFGMLYSKPETDSERHMQELWLARRRQEAFEWKTQQHLSLVMDRLALHKSRMESDALRRQESSNLLKAAKLRPGTSDEAVYYKSATTPVSSRRPLSAHSVGDKGHLNSAAASSFVRPALDGGDDARSVDSRGSRTGSRQSKRSERTALGSAADALVSSKAYAKDTQLLISANGQEINATVRRPGRSQIMKSHSMREGSTSGLLPMRFKTELPSTFSSVDTHRNYMQLSDSDDDDKDEMDPRDIKLMAVGAKPPNKKKGGTNANKGKIEILFKRDRPVTRERPQSAKQFRTVSMNDPEFKIHYRHTNYRRMPMTPQQEQWLEEREKERAKVSVEAAKKFAAEAAAKSDKKKGKDAKDKGKDKGKDKDKGKGKDSKGGKDGKGNPISTEEEKIVPKYKSANEFMAKHFPTFEDEEDAYTIGPMRTSQLMEVARVLNACDEYDVTIRENTIKKALLIPQDKPEAICLENLRDEKEGLMINPIAKQYWRRFVMAKGKKGKKKK